MAKILDKKTIIGIIALLAIISVGISLYVNSLPYTSEPIHWHTYFQISACGQKIDLPRVPQGMHYLGNAMLHTHDDNYAHIEGRIHEKEDITVGKFFDAINVTFSENQIFEFSNGNMCNDGNEDIVRMYVNGKLSNKFENHVMQDKEMIEIFYE